MTTLAANSPRAYQLAEREDYPVIATDIIYEGAAVGENASGYARPLAAGDAFLGFAIRQADIGARRGAPVSPEQKQRITAINEAIEAKMVTNDTHRIIKKLGVMAEDLCTIQYLDV